MGRIPQRKFYAEFEGRRAEILIGVRLEDIQNWPQEQLFDLQKRVGIGQVWGVIEFPREWMAKGISAASGQRVTNFVKACHASLAPENVQQNLRLCLTRLALLMCLAPIYGFAQNAYYLAPTTISRALAQFCRLLRKANELEPLDGRVFANLKYSPDDSELSNGFIRSGLSKLFNFKERGLWADVPIIMGRLVHPGIPSAKEVERCAPVPFVGFSDQFISEAGWRVAWIIRELDPTLLECVEGAYRVLHSRPKRPWQNEHAFESHQSGKVAKFISRFHWNDSTGGRINNLPFEIVATGRGHNTAFSWPPCTLAHLKLLMFLSQMAHLFVFLLSTGGRASEALSITCGDVMTLSANEKRVTGRTYKLVTQNSGASRDWPLPDMALLALANQSRLRPYFGVIQLFSGLRNSTLNEASLFARVESGEDFIGDYNKHLERFFNVLRLEGLTGGIRPHAHRFRKTIARLCALTVIGAPKVLMDLFGHEDIEMTLAYILTDPFIRLEMENVMKGERIMMGLEAVKDVDSLGGGAATAVQTAVRAEQIRHGSNWGEDKLEDVARILTHGGTQWRYARPGLLCIKLPEQVGPCSSRTGLPDVANCQPMCSSRLELGLLRREVDEALEECVRMLKFAIEHDEPVMAAEWRRNIRFNLARSPDGNSKWNNDLLVKEALAALETYED